MARGDNQRSSGTEATALSLSMVPLPRGELTRLNQNLGIDMVSHDKYMASRPASNPESTDP